jgi:hypothetical protein
MRKINTFFIGGLLKDAGAFDVAKIKLVYNFTLFYYFMNLLGSLAFFAAGNYQFGAWGASISCFFTAFILLFLRKQKLKAATLCYFAMHLVIGSAIFFFKKGLWGVADGGMMVVLITFAFFTMNRIFGIGWMLYLLVYVSIGIANQNSGGKILSYEVKEFPPDPPFMVILPAFMITYILWVYLKSKELAEKQIQEQKKEIEQKNKDIIDSIHYAKRIQTSLMPTDKYIDRNINRNNRK